MAQHASLVSLAVLAGLASAIPAQALELADEFAADYSLQSLGSVPGLPTRYGGLVFVDDDTLLIGGAANGASGRLYTIDVTRDATTRAVTGFAGSAQLFGGAGGAVGEYNDGGVVFGPGGVLFTSRWPVNQLGQTKPGSLDEDKVIDLAALGVAGSHAAINFVPAGFAGAGQAKLVSYGGGQWYGATPTPDGNGTYDLAGLAQIDVDADTAGMQNLPGGPEGFVYIAGANAGFGVDSLLVSEYAAGTVSAYAVDAGGDPILSSRRTFVTGLGGAEGATIDPVTGDFLFSTFGGGNQVVRVGGFIVPPPIPEPASWALMLAGGALVGAWSRRRRPA